MSCTQSHSIKLFILRHAWLNLLNKHMTTGRINQIAILAILRPAPGPPATRAADARTPAGQRLEDSKQTSSAERMATENAAKHRFQRSTRRHPLIRN